MAFRLIPKEEKFFADFIALADRIVSGATLLEKMLATDPPAWEVAVEIKQVEEACDSVTHEIIQRLNRTFVTPIDREDIHALASKIDDIIDRANLIARSFSLFDIDAPSAPMTALMKLLAESAVLLEEALLLLRHGKYAALPEAAKRVKALEKQGDTVFRDAIAALFRDPDMRGKDLLRQKDILEDLEDALDICEDVGEFLAEIAVKHA